VLQRPASEHQPADLCTSLPPDTMLR
jgi:hypothetical protein